MLAGRTITLADSLGITVSSMLVVFAVLLILFVVLSLFPYIFGTKKMKQAETVDENDDLIAVIMAVISAFQRKENDPIIRNVGDCYDTKAEIDVTNPMIRDCKR